MDAADKAGSFHFGPGKPADKAQGKADTLLEEHIFECDHGPEDFRDGSSQNAAGEKYARRSRKSQGLSYKVRWLYRSHVLQVPMQVTTELCARIVRRAVVATSIRPGPATSVCSTDGVVCGTLQVGCKMHFSVKRYMHPQLRGMYKIIMSEANHSGHSKDAPIPGHARRGRLSNDAHAHIAGLAVLGVPPTLVISRWHEYLRGQHAARREFPAQVSHILPPTHSLGRPASAANMCSLLIERSGYLHTA